MNDLLVYGANGYTGTLIVRLAVERGLRPVVAGRNREALTALAGELGLEARIFPLSDPAALAEGVRGAAVVLHCAGPFSHTARRMADACLRLGIHYLDVTGEIEVFEQMAARDAEARAAGVMLLPGAGFDVVPSDCLAAHLARRLPSATHLALGFFSAGRLSRGTATTIVENLSRGGLVRHEGELRKVKAACKTRVIDFGDGPRTAVTIPWGDVSTAYYSTGIPNIEVYAAAPLGRRLAMRASRYLGWLLGSRIVQEQMRRRIRSRPPGPTEEERKSGQTLLWGEASAAGGQKVVSRLQGPEGYTFTAESALALVERVLSGQAPPGFQTPARAYGPDFVLGLPGVRRSDE